MQVPLASITVDYATASSVLVRWYISPTSLDLSAVDVHIERAYSVSGPFDLVGIVPASAVPEFTDPDIHLLSKHTTPFYRLRAGDTVTAPTGLGPPQDIYGLEATNRFELILREFAGRRVLVLTKRTGGQRCPECWDALKNKVSRSNCKTCFATGFAGGFYSPRETWAMKPPSAVIAQLTQLIKLEPDDLAFWMSNTPTLSPGDCIVSAEGTRYRVLQNRPLEKAWSATRQTISARTLSRDQVEYDIPIPPDIWEVTSLTAGALREHIRAHNLEDHQATIQERGLPAQPYPSYSPFAMNREALEDD